MKIWAYVVILGVLASGAWYVISLAADNERLTSNNATLTESNTGYVEAIDQLKVDQAGKDEAIKARTKRILALNKQILRAKDEVRSITIELVTEKERECLRSAVPAAIIDFMFDQESSGIETGGDQDMPGDATIQ